MKKTKYPRIVGWYNRYGYRLELERHEGDQPDRPLYEAGNIPHESSSLAPLRRGLPLDQIKAFCGQSLGEFAADNGCAVGPVEYDPDEEEELARHLENDRGWEDEVDTLKQMRKEYGDDQARPRYPT